MLILKLKTVLAVEEAKEKPYEFNGRKGVSCSASITGQDEEGRIVIVTVKGKTLAECQARLAAAKVKVGAPAEMPIEVGVVQGVGRITTPLMPARRD